MGKLYDQWFSHPSWWFNPTEEDDKYITENFIDLLDKNKLSELTDLEQIILYDQIPRHIYRKENAKHIIEYFLQKALNICEKNVATKSLEEWIFTRLPIRHTNDPVKIHKIMEEIWYHEKLKEPLMKKFIKATYQRCPKIQDGFVELYDYTSNSNLGIYVDISDTLSTTFRSNIEKLNVNQVILSISGGVDSMVCSAILSNLDLDWYAVFINYMNRNTAIEEENFLKDWCRKLGVKLYIRRITEINRPLCMEYELRELYESYTRDVRYNTYKYVSQKENIDTNVIMGHNEDDCFENILTNIAQQRKYDNLTGMKMDSIQDNIRFIRPLLNVPKREIYDFAKTYGIEHLPDSTPEWSQRGQVRTIVRPTLENWDHRIVNGLFQLDNHMKDLHGCLDIIVNDMLKNTNKDIDCYSLIIDEIPNIVLCWRSYIQRLLNITPSYKSLESFISRARELKRDKVVIPIKKNLMIDIRKRDKYILKIYECNY